MTTPIEVSLAGRDFLRISDLVPAEAEAILDRAVELRLTPKQPLLPGATLGLYFAKHSTRTRVSFSAGMVQLGGAAVHLAPEELQLSRGESLPDTARALSRYVDALAVRTHAHEVGMGAADDKRQERRFEVRSGQEGGVDVAAQVVDSSERFRPGRRQALAHTNADEQDTYEHYCWTAAHRHDSDDADHDADEQ